jgi:hypothetical protein
MRRNFAVVPRPQEGNKQTRAERNTCAEREEH